MDKIKLLTRAQLADNLGVSNATIWRMTSRPGFPPAVELTANGVAKWHEHEVEDWLLRGVPRVDYSKAKESAAATA